MSDALVPGRVVRVEVPGSSANLGPGFDAVGLALDVRDVVVARALPAGAATQVVASGCGAGTVGRGEDNLVVRAARALWHRVGVTPAPLRLECTNGVPHGRGVGSSAAAVVAGVCLAAALLEHEVDPAEVLDVACEVEGHPDNAAASLLGGLTLGWRGSGPSGSEDSGGRWRAVRVEPHAAVDVVLCVPQVELSTARARAMLPLHVPHDDAAFTAGRSALLVEALTRSPDLLWEATHDRLHQAHRAAAMPASAVLLDSLRAAGHAAVVSGAGPSLLVLCPSGTAAQDVLALLAEHHDWQAWRPGIARAGAAVTRPVTRTSEEGARSGDTEASWAASQRTVLR